MDVTVYIDVLFALNFFMNLVLLFLTALAVRLSVSLWRITLSAGILALYGLLIVVPRLSLLFSFWGRFAVSVLAVMLLCKGKNQGLKWKTVGVFWLIAMSLGGILVALSLSGSRLLTFGEMIYLDISLSAVLLGIGAVYLLILIFCKLSQQRFGRKRLLLPFSLWITGKEIQFTALVDTGCFLTVPVTEDPMLLLSEEVLEQLPERCFSVPIRTASGETTISAFYPERLVCRSKQCQISGIVAVGIGSEIGTASGDYQGVLNPAMLEEGGRKNGKNPHLVQRTAAKNSQPFGVTEEAGGALHRGERDLASALEPGGRG